MNKNEYNYYNNKKSSNNINKNKINMKNLTFY